MKSTVRTLRCLLIAQFPLLFLSTSILAADPPKATGDLAALAKMMAGEYVVIGKRPESDETYLGQIVLNQDGKGFKITRTVAGETVAGTGTFETGGGSDRIPVLRIRYLQNGSEFEGTYQWKTDLDNYFRFTGYVYPVNKMVENPGLEALFSAEPLKPREE